MNPYRELIAKYAGLLQAGRSLPLGGLPQPPPPKLPANAPKALIFSPHPDDECIVGGLALRLLRESKVSVINVAVTQGSDHARRPERRRELEGACGYLGFGLKHTAPDGLENITSKGRAEDAVSWSRAVKIICEIISDAKPRVIFVPHEKDWHTTHIGTHLLVFDALKTLPKDFGCHVVETEFWGAMEKPNLMVESSVDDVADLVAALSFHAGEVRRNPFHLRLPAWMQDNVRRGGEVVSGQGAEAPDFVFATLYRLSRWENGRLEKAFGGGKNLSAKQNPGGVFDANL